MFTCEDLEFEDFKYTGEESLILSTEEQMDIENELKNIRENPNENNLQVLLDKKYKTNPHEWFNKISDVLLTNFQSKNPNMENLILKILVKHLEPSNVDFFTSMVEIILKQQNYYLDRIENLGWILTLFKFFSSNSEIVTKSLQFLIGCSQLGFSSHVIEIFATYLLKYENIPNILDFDNIIDYFFKYSKSVEKYGAICIKCLLLGNEKSRNEIYKNISKYDFDELDDCDAFKFILESCFFSDKTKLYSLEHFIPFPVHAVKKRQFFKGFQEKNGYVYFTFDGRLNRVSKDSELFVAECEKLRTCFQFSIAKNFICISRMMKTPLNLYKIDDYFNNQVPKAVIRNSNTGYQCKMIENKKDSMIHLFSTNKIVFIQNFDFNGKLSSSQELQDYFYYNSIASNVDGNLVIFSNDTCIYKLIWNKINQNFNVKFLAEIENPCLSLDINKNSTLLISANDRDLTIYDIETGSELYFFTSPLLNSVQHFPIFSKHHENLILLFDFFSFKIFHIDENSRPEGNDLNDFLVQVIPIPVSLIENRNRMICESSDGKSIFLGNLQGIWQFKILKTSIHANLIDNFDRFQDVDFKF
eukprot:gene12604-6424_t